MKKKRYWLRGGVFLVIIAILFSVTSIYFSYPEVDFFINLPGLIISGPFLSGCFIGDIKGNYPYCPVSGNVHGIIIDVISLLLYFTIGSIIGFLYGKIKNRNKVSQIV